MLDIETIVSQPFMENTYLLHMPGQPGCVVIDPGLEPGKIVSRLSERGWVPEAILLTHGHADHIGGNDALRAIWPSLPIVIGTNDAPLLADPIMNLSGLAGVEITSAPATQLVNEGDTLSFAGMTCDVLDIPGHSPGHVVYVFREESPLVVLGGDVLFKGSIGRTDFPGGDLRLLVTGIQSKLFPLPADTLVYPGHGQPTAIGVERQSNPFCRL